MERQCAGCHRPRLLVIDLGWQSHSFSPLFHFLSHLEPSGPELFDRAGMSLRSPFLLFSNDSIQRFWVQVRTEGTQLSRMRTDTSSEIFEGTAWEVRVQRDLFVCSMLRRCSIGAARRLERVGMCSVRPRPRLGPDVKRLARGRLRSEARNVDGAFPVATNPPESFRVIPGGRLVHWGFAVYVSFWK